MRPDANKQELAVDLARRDFLKTCVAGAAGIKLNAGALAKATPAKRPNILYIHSHDTGRYIQPYGHAIATPHLQRLAEQGVLFRHAFSAAPTCSPSRASLLTGMCPHSNGMLGLAHRGFVLNDYKQHLLYQLRDAGYYTALVGLQHIAKKADMIGYDSVRELDSAPGLPGPNHVEQVAPAAVEFLNNAPKQPFFLTVGFFETHRAYRQPTAEDDPRFILPPSPISDTPATRQDMAAFKATARVLDLGMGQVFRALDKNGLAENTLVIATTDHGIAFPRMKCDLSDGGMGVYLIMRGPGGFSGGKVCDALISQIDLFPTVCDLLDIKPPSWLQGKSFLPVIQGTKVEIHEAVFSEVNYHAAYEPKRAVRTRRWKYLRHFDDRDRPVLPNCDDGPSKAFWLQSGWRDQRVDREGLYDLIFDPNERRNLAADPSNHNVLEEMRTRMQTWMRATSDPLQHGPVAAPHGAFVNDPDQISPTDSRHAVP